MKIGLAFIRNLLPKKKSKAPSKIEERMVRREVEDLVEIGRSLEAMYNSPAGEIIRAIINGRISLEAKKHREGSQIEPARALGRIEAYQQFLDDVELAIAQYQSLITPLPENQQEEAKE